MEDHRKRTRVEGKFKGKLEFASRSLAMTTENVSLKGVLCDIDTPDAPPPKSGDNCLVVLPLTQETELSIHGKVVRSSEKRVAVDFTSMDEESYSHLRNIIRFSSTDPDAIDREQAQEPFLD